LTELSVYGIAIDIGTTNITIHLINLNDNSIQKQLLVKNPQYRFGADIISRLGFSTKDPNNQKMLVELIRDAVKRGIEDILQEYNIKPSRVSDIVVVGNTVMHHLFFDLSLDSLLRPPYKASNKESISIPAHEVGLDFLTQSKCYSPPVVESFVGPDAIAVLIASDFLESKEIRMTIDVGTNTEISLITPEGIWIASGASGPAFEGMAIECGLTGEVGAIGSVRINPENYEPIITVIGNGRPSGICGTGAVSVMASLLDSGLLLPRGSLSREVQTKWLSFETNVTKYILALGEDTTSGKDIFIAQTDLRMLQQSKAAIRAVIEMLLKKSKYRREDITELFLTGIFGSDLKIEDAYRIGMFPVFDNAQITQVRKGAAKGAGLLLNQKNRVKVEELLAKLKYIELTTEGEFRAIFVESLKFPSK